MPAQFRERGDVSIIELFIENGGANALGKLDEADFAEIFGREPDLVDSRCRWSEDQRYTPTWFVRELPAGSSWEVGYCPDGDSTYFDSRVAACARYTLNYLNGLNV